MSYSLAQPSTCPLSVLQFALKASWWYLPPSVVCTPMFLWLVESKVCRSGMDLSAHLGSGFTLYGIYQWLLAPSDPQLGPDGFTHLLFAFMPDIGLAWNLYACWPAFWSEEDVTLSYFVLDSLGISLKSLEVLQGQIGIPQISQHHIAESIPDIT